MTPRFNREDRKGWYWQQRVPVELVGGPRDGLIEHVPRADIEGGRILWLNDEPYWCETDHIDDSHRASFYPQINNSP